MKIKKYLFILVLLALYINIYSQETETDTTHKTQHNLSIKKMGGIFISPVIGVELPVSKLRDNSKYAVSIGGKLEYASMKIYPFVIGATIQYQKHAGSDDFKTKYILNSLNTKITSFGINIDLLLNKYLKSGFTIPFVFLEAKSISVKREISPDNKIEGINTSDNVIGFGGGFGFTLYIFDIYTSYLSAKDYSTISIKTRFRFPLIKF